MRRPLLVPIAPAAALVLATLSVLAPAPATAQIVNVQPLVDEAETDGFSGEFGGSLTLRTGNTELFLVNGSVLALYGHKIHRLISSSEAALGYKGGVNGESKFLQKLFTHLRWQVRLPRLVTWETYTQAAQDKFKRVSLRALVGTGPRFDFLEGPAVSAALGLSYMFEHERLTQATLSDGSLDPATEDNNHRASLYFNARFVLDPLISFVHTTYYQPLLTDPAGDFRLSSDTGIALKLSKRVSLAITFKVAYDSEPPREVKKTDTGTDVSVAVGF